MVFKMAIFVFLILSLSCSASKGLKKHDYELKYGCIVSDIGAKLGFVDVNDVLYDIKKETQALRGACSDPDQGKWLSKNQVRSALKREGSFDKINASWDLVAFSGKGGVKIIFFPETHWEFLKRTRLKSSHLRQQKSILEYVLEQYSKEKILLIDEIYNISIPFSIDNETNKKLFDKHLGGILESYKGQRLSWLPSSSNITKIFVNDEDLTNDFIFLYVLMHVKHKYKNIKDSKRIRTLIREYAMSVAYVPIYTDFSKQYEKYEKLFYAPSSEIKNKWEKSLFLRTSKMYEKIVEAIVKKKPTIVIIQTGLLHVKNLYQMFVHTENLNSSLFLFSPRFHELEKKTDISIKD